MRAAEKAAGRGKAAPSGAGTTPEVEPTLTNKETNEMKKFMAVAFAAVLMLSVGAGSAFAQSAKSSMQVVGGALLGASAATATNNGWTPILTANIRMSEQKDLIMGVSLETGLFTQTLVRSKGGTADTSYAEAMVEVRIIVDNQREAAPGSVIFDRRYQSLMAKFGGVWNCVDSNGDNVINYSECTITDEELELILDTTAAHHFNFVLDDLGSGDHVIRVETRLSTDKGAVLGTSNARAWIGKGSVTVEEVRFVKGLNLGTY